MARVYRHKNGTYYFQFRGKRRSLKTKDREVAKLAAANIERRRADPTYAAAHEATLTEALQEFVTQQRRLRKAEGTLKMYGFHLGHLARVLGDETLLVEIDAKAVDKYLAKRDEEGAEPSTQGKELSTLRGALRLAARQGKYHRSLDAVMPHNFKIKYTPGTRSLSLVQANALVAALAPKRAAVCAFILATAADLKSVWLAERSDFRLKKDPPEVLVRGSKNRHRWRTIPVLQPFAKLAELAAAGAPFAPWGNVRRDLTVACKKAGLPRVTPRDLRRSHGMILRAMGVEPHLISKMLGHRDARMVELVYGQLPPDALGELMRERTSKPAKKTRATKKPAKTEDQ
jgi:integrase